MPKISLQINGARRSIETDADRSLLSVLRDDLDLTGAKYGCGEGQCGACTVLINGRATRSCITQIGTLSGKQVTTIEGLEQNGILHPLQDAFIEATAMQCGYCIPGMIMNGVGLLKSNPRPSQTDILTAMEGNVCRCGTYARIVAALTRVAKSETAQKGGSK
jgi:aerobic-type carbon monoxide dehydrogenase small subunit (CoxS/CutS family)